MESFMTLSVTVYFIQVALETKLKREPGAKPGRSGHCEWGALGREEQNHESGDLPG